MSVIRPNPPFHPETLLLIEWEYADDGEFADEDENVLRETLPISICKEILEQWNLFIGIITCSGSIVSRHCLDKMIPIILFDIGGY